MRVLIKIFLWVVVLFATMDGMRDTFFLDSPISYVKEICSAVLFFIIFFCFLFDRNKIYFNNFFVFTNAGFVFLLLMSSITTKFYGSSVSLRATGLAYGGWSVWIKVLSTFFLFNSFSLLGKLYPRIYYSIPRYYLYGVVAYSIVTLFFVLSGASSILTPRNWSGRLSIGYPTMDCLVLIVGCVFATFFVSSKRWIFILNLLFIMLLLMQNTVTGYLAFLVYLSAMVFWLQGRAKLLPIFALVSFCVLGLVVYFYFLSAMGSYGALLLDKINGFIFGNDTSSINIRLQQISDFYKILNSDVVSLIFGVGGAGSFLVESQYYSLVGMFGVLGAFLYIFLFVRMMIFLPKKFKISSYYTHSFTLVVLYSVSAVSLTGFYLFPFVFVLAYILSVYASSEHEHKFTLAGVRYVNI